MTQRDKVSLRELFAEFENEIKCGMDCEKCRYCLRNKYGIADGCVTELVSSMIYDFLYNQDRLAVELG